MLHITFVFISALIVEVLSQQPTVNIVATSPIAQKSDKVLSRLIHVEVQRGKDLTMDCQAEDIQQDVSVRWQLVKQKAGENDDVTPISRGTAIFDNTRYSLETPTPDTYRLRVKSISSKGKGNYTCFVMLTKTSRVEQTVSVNVLTPPSFVLETMSSNLVMEEGDSDDLMCEATGYPKPTITWILPVRSGKMTMQNSKLTIENAKKEDAGKYKCMAYNSVGQVQRVIEVEIKYKPEVKTTTPRYQAINYLVELQCIIQANPPPKDSEIVWTKDGQDVLSTPYAGNRIAIDNKVGAFKHVTSELVIKRVIKEDYGTYKCRISNKEGTTEQYIELKESDTPQKSIKVGRVIGSASTNMASWYSLVGIILIHLAIAHS